MTITTRVLEEHRFPATRLLVFFKNSNRIIQLTNGTRNERLFYNNSNVNIH